MYGPSGKQFVFPRVLIFPSFSSRETSVLSGNISTLGKHQYSRENKTNSFPRDPYIKCVMQPHLNPFHENERFSYQSLTGLCSSKAALEEKKGVAGYHETQEKVEKVSAMKSDLDEQKGKTLEDIAELVSCLYNLTSC